MMFMSLSSSIELAADIMQAIASVFVIVCCMKYLKEHRL